MHEHINTWAISTIGILIILSTMTKMIGLPHEFALTQIMSKSATIYVRIIVIILLIAFLLYPLVGHYFDIEPYTQPETLVDTQPETQAETQAEIQAEKQAETQPEILVETQPAYQINPEMAKNNEATGRANDINLNSAAPINPTSVQNFDVSLNLVNPPAIYYQPGSFMIGGPGFVPNYAEGIAISSLTGLPLAEPVLNAPYLSGGFCADLAVDPINLELKCNSLYEDVCASTNCCVLLGGQKCVSGNEKGPTVQANYSDFTIKNRDFYYYKGKCYGNCPY